MAVIFFLVITSGLLVTTCKSVIHRPECSLILQNATVVEDWFHDIYIKGAHVVFFHVMLSLDGKIIDLDVHPKDSFDPTLWTWVRDNGKYILRMPLDYDILSVWLLRLHTYTRDIVFEMDPEGCLYEFSSEDATSLVAKSLIFDVTFNHFTNKTTIEEQNLVCRSAFVFSHHGEEEQGVGSLCCTPLSLKKDPLHPVCQMNGSDGWPIVWIGPPVMLFFLYIVVAVTVYRNVKTTVKGESGTSDKFERGMDMIQHKLSEKLEKMVKDRLLSKGNLLSYHEKYNFLDGLGFSKGLQWILDRFYKVLTTTLFLLLYYGYVGLSLYSYSEKQKHILRFDSSGEVYLNLFGHLGWIYAQPHLSITQYAYFEAAFTMIFPFMALYLYLVFKARTQLISSPDEQAEIKQTEETCSFCLVFLKRFSVSKCGRVINILLFIIVLLYIFFIAGVYLGYAIFMIITGFIVNIDAFAPWVVPIFSATYYMSSAFAPMKEYYLKVKQKLFAILDKDHKDLIMKKGAEKFISKKLFYDFYFSKSKHIIVMCVQKILNTVMMIVLLGIVILAVQYPSISYSDSLSQFLGVNVVVLTPMLSKVALGEREDPAADDILTYDIINHVITWEKDYADFMKKLREDFNSGSGNLPGLEAAVGGLADQVDEVKDKLTGEFGNVTDMFDA